MKQLLIMACISFFNLGITHAQQNEINKISTVIHAFSKAGDANDVEILEQYLDPKFRIVMNRLFNSSKTVVMARSSYLEKIASKEFGGDHHDVIIERITLNDQSATAKVIFHGLKTTFNSLLILVRDKNGN